MLQLDWVGWIFVGLLAGWISGAVVGRGGPTGCLANIAIGILGGILGGWFASTQLHVEGPTSLVGAIVVASLGAIVLRLILNAMDGSDRRH